MSLNRIRRLEVAVKELKTETEELQNKIKEISTVVKHASQAVEDAEKRITSEIAKEIVLIRQEHVKVPPVTKPRNRKNGKIKE